MRESDNIDNYTLSDLFSRLPFFFHEMTILKDKILEGQQYKIALNYHAYYTKYVIIFRWVFETYFISLTRSVERFSLSIEFDDENDDNLMGEQSSLKKGFLAFVIVDELIHMKRKWLCISFEGWSCDKLYYLIRDILCKQYFYEKLFLTTTIHINLA